MPRNLSQQIKSLALPSASTHHIIPSETSVCLTLDHFKENTDEQLQRKCLESKKLSYNFLKHCYHKTKDVIHEFKDLYAYSTQRLVEKSTIYYTELVDENPDSTDTMRFVAELMLGTATSESQGGYVILVGDGKTYQHLIEVKKIYGVLFKKLLIYPGEWHILKNFQPVLMKIYFHAGLKQLAQASGFRAETLRSLEKCSNFSRTHKFLLEVWQALFRALIASAYPEKPTQDEFQFDNSEVHEVLTSVECYMHKINFNQTFHINIEQKTMSDDTMKFWHQFIFSDCFCYIQLFIAIRCQNWDLRNSSLKQMAPLFLAYDRTTYQRLIPYHLADIQKFPSDLLKHFKNCFTISINGGKGHAVALDEAHEMCINKDLKMAISRPTQSYLQKTSLFMKHRISIHKSLLSEIFPSLNSQFEPLFNIFTKKPAIVKGEENVVAMITQIDKIGLFPGDKITKNRGLINAFSNIKATPEQSHDMLNFRKIGSCDLDNYINHFILKKPSTAAPVRKNKLLTMAPLNKVTQKHINQKEKELKQITKCLRHRLTWCNRTGQTYNSTLEQYSLYPRAIADEDGYPIKGVKSVWKDKLGKRYPGPDIQVVMGSLPDQWRVDTVILDAMFFLNYKPLRNIVNIRDYSMFLFNRFILPHYQCNRACEVHVLFDTQANDQQFNPKAFEHNRRDKGKELQLHTHISFTPATAIPNNWKSFIDCRKCKACIIEALGLSFMQTLRQKLLQGQTLYLSGCFAQTNTTQVCKFSGDCLPMTLASYSSNSREADMRIWRHVYQTEGTHIMIYSPDTDVYNIGLSLSTCLASKEIIVQLNLPHSPTCSYLHLNNLVCALERDPDLASLPRPTVNKIFQMLFICSGCDYISYFHGHGKAVFFNIFFQHAQFISGQHADGSLSNISIENRDKGFLAFLRLVGTIYFKKHISAMSSIKNVETPQQLFNSVQVLNIKDKHIQWYNTIRSIVSERISDERDRMPSHTSMWRHWLRCCWVGLMWDNSTQQNIEQSLPSPETCGWIRDTDNNFSFDWECSKVKQRVQDTIDFLTRGCSCRKGCGNQRCGCVKNSRKCGPSCQCHNCHNVLPEGISVGSDQESTSDESDDELDSDSEKIETEIISDSDFCNEPSDLQLSHFCS